MPSEKITALLTNIEPVPPPPPKSSKKFVVTLPKNQRGNSGMGLIGDLHMSKSELIEIFGVKPNMDARDEGKMNHGWVINVNGITFEVYDWHGSWRQNEYSVQGPRDSAATMTGMFGQYFKGRGTDENDQR